MQEVLDLLEQASAALSDVEENEPLELSSLSTTARIFLAHAATKLAEAKLRLLAREEEKPCEKS